MRAMVMLNHVFGNGNRFEGTVSRDPEEMEFTGLGGQRGRRKSRRESRYRSQWEDW